MSKPRATLLAIATFVVGFGLCVALFALLDVDAAYLAGPAVAVAAGAVVAYQGAVRGDRSPPRT